MNLQSYLKKTLKPYKKMKKFDAKREEYRGAIKQLMVVRNLRMINLANFNVWVGNKPRGIENVHSVKIDLLTGQINVFANGAGAKAGPVIDDVSTETYKKIYDRVIEVFRSEDYIKANEKRNILVRVSR